jgi:glucose/arabinose dehydrogenase
VPWGLAFLPDGSALVTLRDQGTVLRLRDSGATPVRVGQVPGVRPLGEAGLLGIAVSPRFASDHGVFVYFTAADDNRVMRMTLDGDSLRPGPVIVDGIPQADHHDGGRLAFGPDGFLYISTGDAGNRPAAQDRSSLGGKILRVTTDGRPAPGNPFPGSRVWSLGHRNVQGLAWDTAGRLYASEFGQDTWDELNQIVPGKNYGWPQIEGKEADGAGTDPSNPPAHYMDPLVTWRTDEASPSGLAVSDAAVYVAALGGLGGTRGPALWRVPLQPASAGSSTSTRATVGTPQRLLHGTYGRLRTVMLDPTVKDTPATDTLLVLTSNTDGRGNPSSDDDRLLRVKVPSAG